MAAAAPDPEVIVQMVLGGMKAMLEARTGPDGPFPLAEEPVEHFGTTQMYRCWQRGPNSINCMTLPELYEDSNKRFGDKELLVYEGSERLTFPEVFAAAAALARALQQPPYNIKKGDCIAIAGRNTPEWVIALLAGTGWLGAMTLPVNSWWVGEELRYGLVDSEAKLLIADTQILNRAPFLDELGVKAVCMRAGNDAPPGSAGRFEELLAKGRSMPATAPSPVTPNDNGVLMYTSGTTSKPKGVVMTHRSVMAAMNCVRMLDGAHEPRVEKTVSLLGSPLFHVNGLHVALLRAISVGTKVVLMYKWNPTRALQLVEKEKVTHLVGVPTMTYDLVNAPDFDDYDTSTLVGVGGGGSAFAGPMIKRVEQKFKNARAGTGYGLTETNAVSVGMPPPVFPMRPTSCGVPVAIVDVSVLSEDNRHLPRGEVGEICFRGSTIMQEYWKKPDMTAEVFTLDSEGKLWFRSGDLGRVDEQGFVYIMDRAKDIIIRGGENISCAEVEGALFEHPAIVEAAAIGVPDAKLGEAVAIAVVLKKGEKAPTTEELKAHAVARLASYKVPSEYYIWPEDHLPQGPTGKVQKTDIRKKIAEMRPKSKL